MKITLKTLKGQQLPLEVQPEMKVGALKALIAETHGQPAETQKLIAYGKVMEDDEKTVADYKIVENGFIVMMTVKAKPVKAAPTEEAKQEEVAQPGVTLPSAAASDLPAATTTAPTTTATQPVAQTAPVQPTTQAPVDPNALPAGVDEEGVNQLVGITGKDRAQCIKALQLARGNADLACSLLFEGVDLNSLPAGAQLPDDGAEYGDEDPGFGGMPGGGAGMGVPQELQALMSNPQFAQMAQRMRENPQFYQQFMARLEQDNPAVFQAIQQNPMAFMNMIMGGNPNIGGGMPGMAPGGMPPGMGAGAGARAGAPAGQPRGPAPGQIQVTQQEMEAIQRLETLGFSRHRCLEAYLACDKNEEFAANFLFENGGEGGDDDAMMQAAMAESAAAQNPVVAEAQPQPQPEGQQPDQPMAEAEPAAQEGEAQEQQPAADADNAQPNNDAGANNNGGNGDGDAGAGDGGEKSAFE